MSAVQKAGLLSIIFLSLASSLHADVIQPIPLIALKELNTVLDWVNAQKSRGALRELGTTPSWGAHVDINNDGVDEWVLAYREGSGGYLTLQALQPVAGGGFKLLGEPPKPEVITMDGPWYFDGAVDPSLPEDQRKPTALVQFAGKIYMTLGSGQGPDDYFRAVYLWERGAVNPACEPFWVDHEIQIHSRLRSFGREHAAAKILEDLLDNCTDAIHAEQKFEYRRQALVQFVRERNVHDCKRIAKRVSEDSSLLRVTTGLQTALATEIQRCEALERSEEELSADALGGASEAWKFLPGQKTQPKEHFPKRAIPGEKCDIYLLPGWKIGYEAKGVTGTIVEMVPKNESVENWTQMITSQTFYPKPATNL